MKRNITLWLLCLISVLGIASTGEGPCGVYLLVNGSSQNYRLSNTDWGDNGISAAVNGVEVLNGKELGTIKSLVLCGGIMVAWANGNDYFESDSYRIRYRIYKQGEEAPDWSVLPLDELTYRSGNDYRYEATDKSINLRAMTDGRGGTWVFETKFFAHKYWDNGSGNGTWDVDDDFPNSIATFYLPEHYYVAGNGRDDANNSWCGGTSHSWWKDYTGNEIVSGSKTFANVAAGNYEFKVTNGYWNSEGVTCNEYSYSDIDLAQSHANVHGSDGGTIKFTTDATSDITVHFDVLTGKVAVTSTLGRFVRLPYSVVGDPVLGITWETDNTATEMSRQEDGTYRYIQHDMTLSAHNGRKFKIVGGHSWAVYQAPIEGDFTVDIPADGTYDLVFDFDPASNTATCTPLLKQDVTISQYQFSTFYSDKAYIVPEGLQAWIFTGVEGDMLTMQAIDIIPANTGVVLYGAASETYTLIETTTDVTYPSNLLKGTTTNTEINNSYTHYILGVHNGDCGLFWPSGTTEGVGAFTNAAGKAYLELGGATPAPARIRGFVLSDHKTPTAVEDVQEQNNTDVYYDMLGRQVRNPQQGGIYIRGGKKVIAQ